MAAKKTKKETKNKPGLLKNLDIFKKAYNTATDIVEKSLDKIQNRIEEVLHDIQKRALFFTIMSLAGLFLLFAISEFFSAIWPWFGKTSGYLIVAVILAVIGFIFKKGMD